MSDPGGRGNAFAPETLKKIKTIPDMAPLMII